MKKRLAPFLVLPVLILVLVMLMDYAASGRWMGGAGRSSSSVEPPMATAAPPASDRLPEAASASRVAAEALRGAGWSVVPGSVEAREMGLGEWLASRAPDVVRAWLEPGQSERMVWVVAFRLEDAVTPNDLRRLFLHGPQAADVVPSADLPRHATASRSNVAYLVLDRSSADILEAGLLVEDRAVGTTAP